MALDRNIPDGKIQGRAIFISYRRADAEGEAGRLFDDLVRAYGDSSVFMDVSGIEPGADFRKAIDTNVSGCGVLLAVIGPTWASVTDSSGNRRLDNPNDYVRLEIGTALTRGVPVIPVLVHAAKMPPLDQLPDDLKDLRYRNSVELTHARWNSDVALLIGALKSYVNANPANQAEPVHATVPVQLPAPQTQAPVEPAKKSRLPLFIGAGVMVVLAAVGFAVWSHMNSGGQQAANPGTTTATGATPAAQTTPAATPSAAPSATTAAPQPAAAASAAGAPGANPAAALIGTWKLDGQNGPKSDSLEQLTILEFGGQWSARAFGTCPGKPCDWGIRKLTMKDGFTISPEPWEPRNTSKDYSLQRRVSVSMALNGDTLFVTVKNQTVNPSGGPMIGMRDLQFKKAQ
jgi:hypothetical protein